MKNIYIDVTNTRNSTHTTGIQRVVTNITDSLLTEKQNVFAVAYFPDKKYRKINFNRAVILRLDNNLKNWIKTLFGKVLPVTIKDLIKKIYIKFRIYTLAFRPQLNVESGDTILLIDSTWNYAPWGEISRLKKDGANLVHVVYDLLPNEHPNWFVPELQISFQTWFHFVTMYCCAVYCISNTVRDRVVSALEGHQSTAVKKVGRLFMGYDFDNLGNVEKSVVKDNKVFITVGTIEPRKNHQFILNAFERIWKDSKANIHWVVVGKQGWKSSLIYNVLKYHPESGNRLFFYENANDQELKKLYGLADCAVLGSIDEGYGLPIIEAINYNCGVLLSDIPVFREFELEECCYFNIAEPNELSKLISEYNKNQQPPKLKPEFMRKWGSCADMLYREIHDLK